MQSLSRFCFTGNLGKDAEVKSIGQDHVVTFSVAVTRSYKDKFGEWKDNTQWINCALWRKGDANVSFAKSLVKGSRVYVEGMPTARAYMTKSGDAAASLEVRVEFFNFISVAKPADNQDNGQEKNYNKFDDSDLMF